MGGRRSASVRSRTCRGDDDIDVKRSRPSIGKTRKVPREERTRVFGWDPISGNHIRASGHSGCIQRPDTWLHPNASLKCQIPRTAGAVTWHFRTCRDGPKDVCS